MPASRYHSSTSASARSSVAAELRRCARLTRSECSRSCARAPSARRTRARPRGPPELRRAALAGRLGQLEQRRPRLLLQISAQRRGREGLGGRSQRRTVTERQAARSPSPSASRAHATAAALATRRLQRSRRRLSLGPRSARAGSARRRSAALPASRSGGSRARTRRAPRASSATGWRRVVHRLRTLDHEHAPARLKRRPRRRRDHGSSMSETSISEAPLGFTQVRSGGTRAPRAQPPRAVGGPSASSAEANARATARLPAGGP